MDVWDTLECLEMIQDYINCKSARMKALGSLGFSDSIMKWGTKIINVVIVVITVLLIFAEVNKFKGQSPIDWLGMVVIRGTSAYFLLFLFVYIPLGGLLFLFCKRRQKAYRKSEEFQGAKQNFEMELEKISRNLRFLHQQLENSKVPEKYRNYNTVLFLRNTLDAKRADDLEEAIAIYEDYVAENNLHEKLIQDNQILKEELARIQDVSQEVERAANQNLKGLKAIFW